MCGSKLSILVFWNWTPKNIPDQKKCVSFQNRKNVLNHSTLLYILLHLRKKFSNWRCGCNFFVHYLVYTIDSAWWKERRYSKTENDGRSWDSKKESDRRTLYSSQTGCRVLECCQEIGHSPYCIPQIAWMMGHGNFVLLYYYCIYVCYICQILSVCFFSVLLKVKLVGNWKYHNI